jgi:hypothetical protein
MSEPVQLHAQNATQAGHMVTKFLLAGDTDSAYQVIANWRRQGDHPEFAELDPFLAQMQIHMERAVTMPKGEAQFEWDRVHRVAQQCQLHFAQGDVQMRPRDVWEMSIAQLPIDTLVVDELERHLIANVGQLLARSPAELLMFKKLSMKRINKIATAIDTIRELLLDEDNKDRWSRDVHLVWRNRVSCGVWIEAATVR